MSARRGSSRLGWAALSALVAVAVVVAGCQVVAAPTSAAATTAAATFAPRGETQEATVTYIVDGDTIHVDIGGQEFRVRYIGMDAPEIAHDGNPGERLGPEATQANASLVANMRVILEKDASDTDQFGRLLRYVWLPPTADGGAWLMVDEELAAEGMADVKSYPPDTRWQAVLQQAEDDSRAAGLGIWSN